MNKKISRINALLILLFGSLQAFEQDKQFVIVTASYNNARWYEWSLNSVIAQKYPNWRMIYVDDCSPDSTGKLVEDYIKKNNLENKITLIRNQTREGNPLINHYRAIHMCKDNEIVVILDGDDALAHNDVLEYLNTIYSNPHTWLTYGQFKNYTNGTVGFCVPMPDFVIRNNTFRYYPHIPSHLRTFYVWLFKQIKREDLMYDGQFFPMTGDMAAMIPMIEMARDHFKFIPEVLYIYNDVNPLNEHKVSKTLQRQCDLTIRNRKRYEPLITSPMHRVS